MGLGTNTDLQSILNQALGQLQSVSGNSDVKSGSSSSQPEYVNSIFGLIQDGQQAVEGNDEQKAKAAINIVEGLLSMLSFSKNQVSKANQEVKNNEDAINKNEQAAAKIAYELAEQHFHGKKKGSH